MEDRSCTFCVNAELSPEREPCKTCSRNYVDKYDKMYFTDWMRKILDLVNDLNRFKEMDGVKVWMIEFCDSGTEILMNPIAVEILAKEAGRKAEKTEHYDRLKIGHVSFVSRRDDDEER